MPRLPIDDYSNDDQALADYMARLPVELPTQLVGPNAANAVNNLFAPVGDKPRYQTWPETMIRSGATLPGDVVQGRIPMSLGLRREDFTDIPNEQGPSPTWLGSKLGLREGAELGPSSQLIERTQDLSGMAGGGALGSKPNATLGSGPVRPELVAKAKEHFGITNNPKEAGYVMPDGSMLDLSGRHYSSGYEKYGEKYIPERDQIDYLRNQRNVDHREISELIGEQKYEWQDSADGMRQFMNGAGAIRNSPGIGFDTTFIPTDKQLTKIISTHNQTYRGEPLKIDISNPETGENLISKDFTKPNVEGVKKWFDEQAKAFPILKSDTSAEAPLSALAKPAPIFYSAVENAVRNSKTKTANADQWLGEIRNQPGVKQEELDWVLHDLPKGPITKTELEQFVNEHKVELKEVEKGAEKEYHELSQFEKQRIASQYEKEFGNKPNEQDLQAYYEDSIVNDIDTFGQTKYSQWQLPGGSNYKEMLLTLPRKGIGSPEAYNKIQDYRRELMQKYGDEWDKKITGQEDAKLFDLQKDYDHSFNNPEFKSSHWNEPNVLAHVRTNERTIPGVGNSLHIEEGQSDLHQKGRKQGYVGEKEKLQPKFDKIEEKIMASNDESVLANPELKDALKIAVDKKIITQEEASVYRRYSDITSQQQAGEYPIMDAPFKKEAWVDLLLKRMIRKAAEDGKDAISWTPGQAQAERYDLSKHLDKVEYNKEMKTLHAFDKNGKDTLYETNVPPEKLADYIGKEAAQKLLDQSLGGRYSNVHKLEGLDLKIGGEFHKKLYDETWVNKANAIAKKFGGKVEQAEIKEKGVEPDNSHPALADLSSAMNKELTKSQPIHVLRITPQLRDAAINKGFSLFADSGRVGAPLTALTKVEHNPFTTDAYHGAPKGFKGNAINTPEFFSTPNPNLAGGNATPISGGYARSNRPISEATGNSVMPLKLDTREYSTYDASGKIWQEVNNRAIWEAQQAGKKGVVIKNVVDSPDSANKTPQTINITLDGATVRSKFAKFDPDKFHESGLLKASGLPIITDKDGKQLDHNLKPLTFDEQNALLNRNPLPTHKVTEPDKPINKTALALAAMKAGEYAVWAKWPSIGGPLWAASIVGNAAYNAAPIKQRREGQPLGRYKLRPVAHDPFASEGEK